MKRDTRKLVAEDTLRILEQGAYEAPGGKQVDLAQIIQESKEGTVCHLPEDCESMVAESRPTGSNKAAISVINQTSLQGAMDLLGQGLERVACLNFASAKNPGGGFLGGAEAQEEAICRPSGLYASLMTQFETYYENNRKSSNALYTDHLIYSPNVPVFRSEDGELLEEPYLVSFVTSPAPNYGAVAQNSPELIAQVETVFRRRIEHVLAAMAAHSHRNIILGAWGCGVFRNDPAKVAAWFREALVDGGWIHAFDQIRFSVLDRSKDLVTFRAFESALS